MFLQLALDESSVGEARYARFNTFPSSKYYCSSSLEFHLPSVVIVIMLAMLLFIQADDLTVEKFKKTINCFLVLEISIQMFADVVMNTVKKNTH